MFNIHRAVLCKTKLTHDEQLGCKVNKIQQLSRLWSQCAWSHYVPMVHIADSAFTYPCMSSLCFPCVRLGTMASHSSTQILCTHVAFGFVNTLRQCSPSGTLMVSADYNAQTACRVCSPWLPRWRLYSPDRVWWMCFPPQKWSSWTETRRGSLPKDDMQRGTLFRYRKTRLRGRGAVKLRAQHSVSREMLDLWWMRKGHGVWPAVLLFSVCHLSLLPSESLPQTTSPFFFTCPFYSVLLSHLVSTAILHIFFSSPLLSLLPLLFSSLFSLYPPYFCSSALLSSPPLVSSSMALFRPGINIHQERSNQKWIPLSTFLHTDIKMHPECVSCDQCAQISFPCSKCK